MLHGAYAFRLVAVGHPIGRRALLNGLKINAGAPCIALGTTQRFSGDATIWGAVGREDAAFPTGDDGANWQLRYAHRCVAGGLGGPLGGLAGLPPDAPHHRNESSADVADTLLHPVPERIDEALGL